MLGSTGFSPLGNLRWYLGLTRYPSRSRGRSCCSPWSASSSSSSSRRDPRRLVLLAGGATFLVSISMSQLHRDYWPLPILPVFVLFAVDGGAWLTPS